MTELRRATPPLRGQISALRAGSAIAARVVAVAEAQWGVLARRQLLAAGLSSNDIDRWVRSGRLHRIGRGVYAVGHRALPLEARLTAALFAAGSGAALSHWSALHWWGLQRLPPCEIHIASLRRPNSGQGVVIHRPRELLPVYHRRLPVTSVSRALVDVADATQTTELRRLLAEAEYQRLLDLEAL